MSEKELLQQIIPLIDNWIDFKMYIDEIPGLAIGLFVEDEIIFQKEYGYANLKTKEKLTKNHLFRIASHSKLFTATAIMKLYQEDKLSIDDRVSKHLPWFSSKINENYNQIRIRHLLSHSSGLSRDGETGHWISFDFPDKNVFMEQINKDISVFQSNEHLKYSNYGYTLLGLIIESVSGIKYENYIQTHIFEPLNMTNSLVDISEKTASQHTRGYKRKFPRKEREEFPDVSAKIMNAATGLSSNVEDLIKFYQAHMFGNDSLFPDYIKREMQRVQYQSKLISWGWGFSIADVNGTHMVGHGGGYPGYITLSRLDQKQKLIIVILTNAMDGAPNLLTLGIVSLFRKITEELKTLDSLSTTKDFSDFIGFYGTDWSVTLFGQIQNTLVSIDPFLESPAAMTQIYKHKEKNEFIVPSNNSMGSSGQTIEFAMLNGKYVLKSSGAIAEPFEFEY